MGSSLWRACEGATQQHRAYAASPTIMAFCRICILAGDISPIDVLTHIPILCEDHQVPYIYVPSKEVGVSTAACLAPPPLSLFSNPCARKPCGAGAAAGPLLLPGALTRSAAAQQRDQ